MLNKEKQKGFTLIEMVVAVSIFVVVALIVSLVFVSLAQANRKAQALKLLIDNLNFSMDTMVLNLKTGRDYECPDFDGSLCRTVRFKDLNDEDHEYKWEDGKILEDNVALTSNDITITYANFAVDDTPGARPLIQITISGEAQSQTVSKTEFNLQTVVSQRNW